MNPELNASALPIVAAYDDPSGFYVIRATDDFMVTTIHRDPQSSDIVDQFAEALEPITLSDDMDWSTWMLTDSVAAVWAEDAGVDVPDDVQRLVLVNGRTFGASWADVVLVNDDDDVDVDPRVGARAAYTTAKGYGMTGRVVSVENAVAVVAGDDGVTVRRSVTELSWMPDASDAKAEANVAEGNSAADAGVTVPDAPADVCLGCGKALGTPTDDTTAHWGGATSSRIVAWSHGGACAEAADAKLRGTDSTVVNPHNVRLVEDGGHVFGQWSPEALTADTSEWLEDAVMVDLQPDGSVAVALHANIPTNLNSSADADAMVRLVLPREVAESIAYLILGHD